MVHIYTGEIFVIFLVLKSMTIAQISGGIIKVLEVINSKFCNLARILESLIINLKVSLLQGHPQVKEGRGN